MKHVKLKYIKSVACAVIFSLTTMNILVNSAYANEKEKQSASTVVDCPCIYDEPFASVSRQIKNNLDDWQYSPPELQELSDSGTWNAYELFHLDQKRHTLRLKLSKQTNSTVLFCSWIQWTHDGKIQNQIGMGHHLYTDLAKAESAHKSCISRVSARLPVIAKSGRSRKNSAQHIVSGL